MGGSFALSQAPTQSASTGPLQNAEVHTSEGDRSANATSARLPCTGPEEPTDFGLYSLGETYDGLSLEAIIRRCDSSGLDYGSANYVSYIYGDCSPSPGSDGGCAPPYEIQIWPACERSLDDYDLGKLEVGETRGVPSITLSDRTELYSADATIVVFGPSLKDAAAASEQVVAGGEVAPTRAPASTGSSEQALPEPERGALDGSLRCVDTAETP